MTKKEMTDLAGQCRFTLIELNTALQQLEGAVWYLENGADIKGCNSMYSSSQWLLKAGASLRDAVQVSSRKDGGEVLVTTKRRRFVHLGQKGRNTAWCSSREWHSVVLSEDEARGMHRCGKCFPDR